MAKADEDKKPTDAGMSAGGAQAAAGAQAPQAGGANQAAGRSGNGRGVSGGQSQTEDAIATLKEDHRRVEGLFAQAEKATGREKEDLARRICSELMVHTLLEEEIFYPAARAAASEDQLQEAQVEHDCAKVLIVELLEARRDDYRDAKLKVLAEEIRTHIAEEEAPDGLFAKTQKAGLNTPELADRLARRRQELQTRAERDRLPPPRAVSFQAFKPSSQESRMARQAMDRDERGRFTSDDDRGRGRSRYDDDDDRLIYRSRSRDDDDDDRRGSRRAQEERSYASRARGRDEDDDDRDRMGRRRGGWFGDPEGHAEAAREGWEERRGYSSRSRSMREDDDDDRRYRSRSRDEDDDRDRLGRRRGGWFGDPEGHAEAAREGWEDRRGYSGSRSMREDDDDRRYRSRSRDEDDDRDRLGRRRGGWFGDPEAHAEAAREGWEERRGYYRSRDDDDDDRRYRSRSRDYDDDRDRLGRRRGGWFGDPGGHSEAARRGRER
jgi:hypothetical protein